MAGVLERSSTSGPPRTAVFKSPIPVSACHRRWYSSASAIAGYAFTSSRVVANTNSSEISRPFSSVVLTLYSITRTRIGWPSLRRGGVNSDRYVPSGSTCRTGRVNEADIRQSSCAPGRGGGPPEPEGGEVPVGQHEHSRAQRRQQVLGQGLLPGATGPVRGGQQHPGAGLGQRQRPQL